MPINDAVTHVAFSSAHCHGLYDSDAINLAIQTIDTAIREKKIKVMGRKPGKTERKKIKARDLKSIKLSPESCRPRAKRSGGQMVRVDDPKTVEFESLVVDRTKIERLWPQSNLRHSELNRI